jgi:DNA-binding winged helix-turn-helix (wHTH) protein
MGHEVGSDAIYKFGPFCLDARKHELTKKGKEVDLDMTPRQLLLALVKRHGELVSKEVLIKEVWGSNSASDESFHQHISVLRRTLGGGRNKYIINFPWKGYKFVAPVEVVGTANVVPAEVHLMAPQVQAYGDTIAVAWPVEPQVTDRSGAVVRAGDIIIVPVIDEDDGKVRDCPCAVVRACDTSNELLVLDCPEHVLGILKVGVEGYIYVEADAMGRTDPDKMLRLDVDASLFRKAPVVDGKGDVLKVLVFPRVVPGLMLSAGAE